MNVYENTNTTTYIILETRIKLFNNTDYKIKINLIAAIDFTYLPIYVPIPIYVISQYQLISAH